MRPGVSMGYFLLVGSAKVALPSAHLGTVRHRSEVVEFRIDQHLEALKDRLGNVGFLTRNVTRDGAEEGNEEPRDTDVSTGEDLPQWARRDSNARPLAPEASALSN